MKIVVTGGLGFMGSNFIRYLLDKYPEYSVVNLDKLTYAGNPENLRDIEKDPRYTFVRGDIAIASDVKKAIGKGADAIINYAAETHVDRSIMDPDAFIRTDVFGTYTLLEAVKEHKISRYIQISTDEVYGSIMKGEFTEKSPYQPNSPYAASKAGGDHLVRAYHVTYELPVIITHSCNFVGPYQYPEKLVPLFITNLVEGKKIPVYGKGDQVREWIYTKDHCRAIDLLLHKGKEGEEYNIGSGERKQNIEVTKKILGLMDKGDDSIEHVKDRAGHDVRYAVNSNKLRKELGWKPEYSFDKAIEETVKWYKENEKWWRPLKSGEFLEYYKKQYQKR